VRVRFFRRFAWLIGALLLSALIGVAAVGWLAAANLGLVSAARGGSVALIVLAAGFLGGVAAVVTLGRTLRRVGSPLAAVMDAANRVAAGDYSVRVGEYGPPPMVGLAHAFNTMTQRLQDHDRQRRELMADVAHELRTPLTVMQGKVEGLIDGVYPLDAAELKTVLEETHVLSRLVEDLRTLALSESGALQLQRESTDIVALAREAVRTLEPAASASGVTVGVDGVDGATAEVDPVRIREVLINLLSNALRHTPAGGAVIVRIGSEANNVSVRVQDSGAGMSPGDLARAFDRFHKGADSRGSGLGLSIAKGLVVAHGGEISASSEPGRGTAVAFTVPREEQD
jgi:two-component system OmpR family sensor kinase/two-component system sensor histidine kinase BaeS